MPGVEAVAQYGIGFFAVLVLAYVFVQTQKQKKASNGHDRWIVVVENNTRATEHLVSVMASFRETMMQIMARQDAKLDELLARARRE